MQTLVTEIHSSVAFVSLVFPHDIYKADAARITKLDTEMFHRESWKPFILGVKVTRYKSQCCCGYLHSCECWLLLIAVCGLTNDILPFLTEVAT